MVPKFVQKVPFFVEQKDKIMKIVTNRDLSLKFY